MFCQVKVFSKCKDIERVKQSLFLSDRYGDNWLSECQVSLSPCGSVLAFGRQERLSILCTQWDSSSGSTTFVNSWSGTLPGEATALLALPISSCGQSSQVYSDWVCIAVGFRSGDVGFYTEQGQLLLSEKLEDSPVLSIKCYTGRYGNESDELSVVYGKAICRLASSNLLQLLCYARVQLAREQAGGVKEGLDGNTVLTKKFGFNSYNLINDASIVGLDQTNTFDYLANASIHDGFYTRSLRSVAPHNTVVVGVGDPYIGFHHALEGGTAQPLLTEVARAAANKIMGWFGGGRPEPAVNTPPMASDHLLPALELRDPPRRGLQALPSPDRRLLLLHDSLGRLGLMDVRRGTVVRLFKGYRDGQCGFLEVHEKNHKRRGAGPGRRALFLILYIGKRGQLEVWPLRGPRIAAFSAAQHGRLLYSAYGSLQQGNHRTRNAHPSLALIDPDGQIKQLSIPFHFALSNENSDRARDVHLVRRLRLLIKEKECDYDQLKKEVINTVKELKTSDIKIHCIEMMAASRNVPPGILLIYINCLQVAKLENEASLESTKLKVLVNNLNALVRLFMCVNNIAFDDLKLEESLETKVALLIANSSSETQTDDDLQEIPVQESRDPKEEAEPSLITEKELMNFQHLLNLAASAQQKRGIHSKVTFIDDKRSLHSDFLVPFDISADDCYLKIKDSATRESLCFVAQQIFDPCVDGNCDWKSLWKTCSSWKTFIPSDLCKLLFLYWMEKPISDITFLRMESFGKILLDICDIKGFDNIYVGYGDTSPWWQSIRNLLVDAPCPFRSMVTAQICRAVAQKIERDVESNQNSLDDNAWVSLSKDNAQWGLLIGKLDDISLLSIILSQTLEPVNKIPKLLIELPEINLKYIYSSGKGSISELTAKWLCSAGVDPKDIIETSSEGVNKDEIKSPPQGLMSFQVDSPKINDISQKDTMSFHAKLNLLKKQFPFSLNTDSLIINMCWEYSKYWVKHMDQLTYLKTMVYCLKSVKQVPMRCGISSLIWSTHLIHSFESAYKLISKVGKLPREKLCQQNIGLSDSQLLKYLEIAYDFFDVFLCSALSSGESQEIVLKFEPIWEESSLALTELTLANSKVNIDVLQVHYQLCAAIYYQSYLGTNYWKHLNYLFDMESQRCAFGPLKTDSHVFVGHQSIDSRVTSQRHQFLVRLVNKCAELPAEQDVWIERVHDLARIWRVDSDHVRRIYVSRLYGQGLDSLAEDALASVTDAQPLLKLLVPLAGRRLRSFMEGITNKGEVLAILPTLTTSYIQSLEEVNNEVTVITSLKPTRNLLEAIIARGGYDSSSPLLKTANMLLDSCTTIQQHLGIGK